MKSGCQEEVARYKRMVQSMRLAMAATQCRVEGDIRHVTPPKHALAVWSRSGVVG